MAKRKHELEGLSPEHMHPHYARHPGVRQVLDQFGSKAVDLELVLKKSGEPFDGARLLAIAVALREAYLLGRVHEIEGVEDVERGG